MRVNTWTRRKKSAGPNTFMRRIDVRDLSRRWDVRLAAIAILIVGVYTAVNRADDNVPAPVEPAVAPKAAVVAAAPVKTSPPKPAAAAPARRAAGSAEARPAEAPADKPVLAKANTVTITGCLERDDEMFRLKDTDGEDAPKSRSWKTGFLTKRKATIALDPAANGALQRHAGERVSVTGVLVDREMQVHSLQRVAASCR